MGPTLREVGLQAACYDTRYHLVEAFNSLRKKPNEIQVLAASVRIENEQKWTWEALGAMTKDVPNLVTYFIHTSDDGNIIREMLDLAI